jgi:hypothetical protein
MVEIPKIGQGDGPCQSCKQPYLDWHCDNAFWNNVIAEWKDVPFSAGDPGAILCFTCFGVIAYRQGWDLMGFTMSPQWRWQRR